MRPEILPKAVFHGNVQEIEFYDVYFRKVQIYIRDVDAIVGIALQEAERYGIIAMNALHVAAAFPGEAEVLYTLERPEKPIYRTSLVRVLPAVSEA